MVGKQRMNNVAAGIFAVLLWWFIGESPMGSQALGIQEPQENQHASDSQSLPEQVTYHSDVAPILFDKCAGCHRPGQVGPFPLLTYDDASQRARTILAVIESGYMPPWKPINHNLPYANDRRLTDRETSLLQRWVQQGKRRGDERAGPSRPEFPEKWMLGEPDLVVKMNGQFQVPASGPDIYRSFVFPLDLKEDKWVKAVELRPTARQSVHHALFFIDGTRSARKQDGQDGRAGISGMSFLALANGDSENEDDDSPPGEPAPSDNWWQRLRGLASPPQPTSQADRFGQLDRALSRGLGGYVPGAVPARLPDDLAMHLPAGSDVIMQTHFHPAGKPEIEQAELGLYFADKPPSQQLVPIQVPAMFGFGARIDVPPGESDYVIEDAFTLPVAVQVISVGGHAHYICREMSMEATLPDGTSKMLMEIDDWDLDWQDRYYFQDRVQLPAGTKLKTRLVYDNSEQNPENPHQPPKRIRWGRQSTDEMGSVTLQVVAQDEAERPELESHLRQYFLDTVVRQFRDGNGMVRLLRQLDSDGDGMLQRSEAPPRLSRNFSLFDRDRNNALDREELERVAEVMARLRGGSQNP